MHKNVHWNMYSMYLYIRGHEITPILFNSENANNSLQTCRTSLSRTACRIERKKTPLSEVFFLISLLLCNFTLPDSQLADLTQKCGGTKTTNQKEVRYMYGTRLKT